MAGSVADEDEEVLDISEQTRRPLDTALRQQRIRAWTPYLDPWWVIGTLFVLAAIFIPVGFHIQSLSNDIVEVKMQYDKHDHPNATCFIGATPNAGRTCELSFTAPRDMEPPIFVHYELENFYQNHRNYIKSRDDYQLLGSLSQYQLQIDACYPLNQLGDIKLNPCGLIANTLFNDVIQLTSGVSSDGGAELVMLEKGIAWASDLKYKFAQPEGFHYQECPNNSCDDSCCDGPEWSCTSPYEDDEGNCFRYYYPNENTTQYLYETYPMVVSPIEGVLNEHFVVWMRVATLPTFRKLYGYIEQPIAAGTNITFTVTANYEVASFKGAKSLVISTNNIFGGKNAVFGPLFYWSGFVCLGVGLFFCWKQTFRPRKIADKSYLHFKQD